MRDTGTCAQTTLPFADGSITSLRAAEQAEEDGLPQLQRNRLMIAYEMAGLEGLTDQEAQHQTGLSGDSQRPRRQELQRMGLIEPAGERKTKARRGAVVWRLRSLEVR